MADLSVQSVDLNGLTPTFTSADPGGDSFTNTGKELLIVENTGASAITVTIDSVTPCNYGFDHDVNVTIAAGETKDIGVFPVSRFNDDFGKVNISYSDATNVNVAVIKIA